MPITASLSDRCNTKVSSSRCRFRQFSFVSRKCSRPVCSPLASSSRQRWIASDASKDHPKWGKVIWQLAVFGAISGTLLDGIHSASGLQVYDVAPVVLGGVHTSLLVPPLLAAFYVVLGTLHPLLDTYFFDEVTAAARQRAEQPAWLALGVGLLAAWLQLSATLYSSGTPPHQILLVLSVVALINWRVLDGTRQGLLLATVCATGAPVAEVILNAAFHLWHYPSGDILKGAFVSWVPLCYWFYTPALGNLGRYLWYNSSYVSEDSSSSSSNLTS